jgi:multidrug efflux pump subunit AcrB
VRDDLLRILGITQVELAGAGDYEIALKIPQDRLRQYDLTLAEVSAAVANSSSDISAGNIKTDAGDVLIRSKGQYYRKDEFADSLPECKEELQIELTQQGKALVLTRVNVSNQVRNAFFGSQVQRIQRGRDDVRVMVRLPIGERRSLADLQNILFKALLVVRHR